MGFLLVSIFVISLMGILLIPNAFGTTQIVIIPVGASSGDHFDPSIIEIKKDDAVKWANLDRNTAHTVTSTSTNWTVDSGDLLPNNDQNYCYPNCKPSFSYTFDAGGTYDYGCKIHSWMKGVVKVIEIGAGAELAVHGYAGDMYIDKSQYEVIEDGSVKIKIYGEVKDPGASAYILFTITKPDGSTSELKTYRTGEGYYQLILSINYEDRGTYNVVSTYGLENIGTANFVVVERPNPTIENPFPPSDDESTNVIESSQNNQENALTVTTDRTSYKKGDMIKISGMVPYLGPSDPNNASHVTFVITDPRNNIITVSQISPNDNRMYSASINGDGPLWKLEGDYTVKANFADSNAETKFAFTIPGTAFDSPAMESQAPSSSKTSTLLILNPLPNYFETTVRTDDYSEELPFLEASIYVSGKLTTKVGQRGIAGAHVDLVITPVAYGSVEVEPEHIIYGGCCTTDNNGEFEMDLTLLTFDDNAISYSIYADYDVESDRGAISNYIQLHDEVFHSSQSQIEYFDVRLGSIQSVPLQPQTTAPTEDSSPAGGVALLVIIMIVVIVAIAIKKRKKKIPVTIPPPSGGGTAGRASKPRKPFNPRAGRAPLLRQQIRKAKRAMGKQSPKAKSYVEPIHYMRCKHCHLEEFLENEADGQQYCTKCGWKKQ